MGITVAVTRVACDTGGGDQTITLSDLGGQTPKAALFIITEAVTDGTAANHAVIGIGAATSTSERWALCSTSENALATTDTYRRGTKDECIMILNPADGTIDGEADLSSFGADEVTINWGNAPAAAYLLTCITFAGSNLSAKAATSTLATQNNTVDINTVGFEPDVIFFGTHCTAFNDTSAAIAYFSHGVALNNTDEQYCYVWGSDDAQAAAALYAQIRDDYAFAQVGNAALDWAGEVGSFDADGFSITSRLGNPGTDEVGYLALGLGGAVSFEGNIITTPTSTGNQGITDPSFIPQYVHCGLTQMPVVNTHYTTSNAGSIGISTFDIDNGYSNSIQDDDAADPTNTQSLSDDTVINLPLDDGTAGHVASFVSFDANGWTWNFTTTQGTAVQYWYLAIGINEYTQSVAGALTNAGALTKSTTPGVLAGTLTAAGVLIRQTQKILAGTLTTAGVLIRQAQKILAGTLTTAGNIIRAITRSLVGTLTSAGSIIRQVAKPLAGTLTSAGNSIEQAQKVLSSTLSNAGTIIKSISISQAGTLTNAGTIAKQITKSFSGALTSAGIITRQIGINLSAILSISGAIAKQIAIPLAGTLANSGILSAVKIALLALAGTLTSSGTLARQVGKSLSGILSSGGTIGEMAGIILSGALNLAGAITTFISPANFGIINKGNFKAARRISDRGRRR